MNNRESRFRLPAEWETDSCILLAWPHPDTDWNYMLADTRACYVKLVEAITGTGRQVILIGPGLRKAPDELSHIAADRLFTVDVLTNDTWTRDYGPLTLIDADGSTAAADFRFNGWGLKFAACHDNLVTPRLCSQGLITAPRLNLQSFVLEGGGIESDGRGTLLTTSHCQLSPNRNPQFTRDEIESRLCGFFGAERVLWLNHGFLAGDDTDSHIDTLARFAPHDTIIYVGCDDHDDEHYTDLQAMKQELAQMRTADGLPYNLIELPLPDPVFDEDDGTRLPATYANFLVTPDALFMPVYGQSMKDELARRILSIAFTQPIYTVDCRALIRQHGSLHCATMQIPKSALCI